VAERSKTWACSRCLLGLQVRIPPGARLIVSSECCALSGRGQKGPTECGVSECDGKASIMKRPWSTKGC
jgi:hypothetical protein